MLSPGFAFRWGVMVRVRARRPLVVAVTGQIGCQPLQTLRNTLSNEDCFIFKLTRCGRFAADGFDVRQTPSSGAGGSRC